MGILTSLSIEEIRARGSIRDGDVLKLKRPFEGAQPMTMQDAEALLALHEACPVKHPSWADFLVEALTEFVVNQMQPEGYIVTEKARWLTSRIGQAGRVKTHAELTLLVAVIEAARWAPPSLAAFALAQVRHAVAMGSGPLRHASPVEPGTMAAGDIDLVRRILLSFCREDSIAVTRAEADALLDIDAAVRPGCSSPAWSDLCVKAVGNGTLAALGRRVPARGDVLAEAAAGQSPFGFPGAENSTDTFGTPGLDLSVSGRMISGGVGRVWSSCRLQSAEERAMARLERQRLEIVTNERIEEPDEAWLTARLSQPEGLRGNALALLAYIDREAHGLPQRLSGLAARAVIAA